MPRAKKPGSKSNIVSLDLTPEIHAEIKRLAAEDERSVSQFVKRLVRDGVQRIINAQNPGRKMNKNSVIAA